MHLLKHILTDEERNHLELYKQMIDSNDIESNMLVGSLVFNEFKKYKCPFFIGGKLYFKKIKFPKSQTYWKNRIENLLSYGYYCY